MYCRLYHCLEGPHTYSHCSHSHIHFLVLTPTFNSHFHFQSSQSSLPLQSFTPTSILTPTSFNPSLPLQSFTPTSILTPTSNPHFHFQSSLLLQCPSSHIRTFPSVKSRSAHMKKHKYEDSPQSHGQATTSKKWMHSVCGPIHMHIAPVCYFSNPTNGLFIYTAHYNRSCLTVSRMLFLFSYTYVRL